MELYNIKTRELETEDAKVSEYRIRITALLQSNERKLRPVSGIYTTGRQQYSAASGYLRGRTLRCL